MTPPSCIHYLKNIGLIVGCSITLIAFVNFLVDPYTYFGNNKLGIHINAERQFKPLAVYRGAGTHALIIGNSKTAMIDPADLKSELTFFNASVGGLLAEEMLDLVERIPPNTPLVIIGFDLGQFTDSVPIKSPPFPETLASEFPNYLFSRQTFTYSLKTLTSALRGKTPKFSELGAFETSGWFKHYDTLDQQRIDSHWKIFEENLHLLKLSDKRLQLLVQMRAELDNKKIPYQTFINIIHEKELSILEKSSAIGTYQQWKKHIFKQFPNTIDLSNSEWSSANNFFRSDPVHYYPEVGAKFMNEIIF